MKGIFALLLIISATGCKTQQSLNGSNITAADLEQPKLVFSANMANPVGGRSIPLTPYYDVIITKDSVIAVLPYFGRAYTPSANPLNGGIQFTSTRFSYAVAPSRKNGWDVTIKPADVPDIQQVQLSVSSSGNAILYVTSTNRQAISFNGTVKKR